MWLGEYWQQAKDKMKKLNIPVRKSNCLSNVHFMASLLWNYSLKRLAHKLCVTVLTEYTDLAMLLGTGNIAEGLINNKSKYLVLKMQIFLLWNKFINGDNLGNTQTTKCSLGKS